MSKLPAIFLAPGREKPVRQRHPWIFSGAVKKEEAYEPGTLVDIRAADGRFLARGYGNQQSKIRARILTWDGDETIDQRFWETRIHAAIRRRDHLMRLSGNEACRLVMSEADHLPGLIVDKYADYLVVQALTAGVDRHLETICAILVKFMQPRGIIERSDDHVRELEGLAKRSRVAFGEDPPAGGVNVREAGLVFSVDLLQGHKTGFYLDQRRSHHRVRQECHEKDVLDCFSYTGGFTLNAAIAGAASILSLDQSETALARLRTNLAANGLDANSPRYRQECGNAFELLRALRDKGQTFDLVTLDPPKFAATGAQVDKAARGYKDVNILAMKLLRPGGLLATFSCSGHISQDLFQKIVHGAALDAGRDVQIVDWFYQSEDHPVLLSFPESLYLKGLFCHVL